MYAGPSAASSICSTYAEPLDGCVTQQPITEVLHLNGLRPIPDAGGSRSARALMP